MHLPEGSDAMRDAVGLILAILRDDEEGQAAILANCDMESLAKILGAMAASALAAGARQGQDPDAPPRPLTAGELAAAEASLIAAIEGPDDEL